MIFKEAIQSIMNSKSRAFFYWLTFVLTSMFIFLFTVICMSDEVGVTLIHSQSDIPTNLMITSVVLCTIDIFFTNDFYVKNKSEELAIRMICGATFVQLAAYLLIQTVILLLIAIPVGILGGIALIPVLNSIIGGMLNSTFVITINLEALMWTVAVLGYVVFWTVLLNLSFAYRNSAVNLLNPQSLKINTEPFLKLNMPVKPILKQIASILCFLLPLVLMYVNHNMALELAIVSLVGFALCVKEWFGPFIDKSILNHINDPEKIGSLGFYRFDIKVLKINVVLLIVSSILLVSTFVSADRALDKILVLLTYAVMNALLSLAIMFKFSSELNSRPSDYQSLSHIGYSSKNEAHIISKEIRLFYGTVLIILLVYLANMYLSLVLKGLLSIGYAGELILLAVVPLIICAIINQNYYKKMMFQAKQKHID